MLDAASNQLQEEAARRAAAAAVLPHLRLLRLGGQAVMDDEPRGLLGGLWRPWGSLLAHVASSALQGWGSSWASACSLEPEQLVAGAHRAAAPGQAEAVAGVAANAEQPAAAAVPSAPDGQQPALQHGQASAEQQQAASAVKHVMDELLQLHALQWAH